MEEQAEDDPVVQEEIIDLSSAPTPEPDPCVEAIAQSFPKLDPFTRVGLSSQVSFMREFLHMRPKRQRGRPRKPSIDEAWNLWAEQAMDHAEYCRKLKVHGEESRRLKSGVRGRMRSLPKDERLAVTEARRSKRARLAQPKSVIKSARVFPPNKIPPILFALNGCSKHVTIGAMKQFTEAQAEQKRQQAIAFLERIGEDPGEFEEMSAGEYAQHRGAEIVNPRRGKKTMTKTELDALVDELADGLDECLDPSLTREEVIQKVQDLSDLASGEEGGDEGDANGGGDDQD